MKKYLNDNTADVNAKDWVGWIALHDACNTGYRDTAELLLDHGADIEARSSHNHTPLMYACCHDHTASTTKLLLDRGAKERAVNNSGDTALHLARWTGSKDCGVEELSWSIENNSGKTPLHVAQEQKHHVIGKRANQFIVDLLTEHNKRMKQPIMDSVQGTSRSSSMTNLSITSRSSVDRSIINGTGVPFIHLINPCASSFELNSSFKPVVSVGCS